MKIFKFLSIIFIILNFNSFSFANMTNKNTHSFSFTSIDGKQINLSDFKNKVVLIVNTASKCGFTPQYQGLQNLHNKYKEQGLVVIGVPSKDFAGQEFNDEQAIKKFTNQEFKVNFTLTEITKVKGKNAHDFYLWAKNQVGFIGSPKWNFHKYLIDKEGNLSAWFSSTTNPEAQKITNKIEELL